MKVLYNLYIYKYKYCDKFKKNISGINNIHITYTYNNYNIYKYIYYNYFIRNFYYKSNIKYDEKLYPYNFINDVNIIKNKNISWDYLYYIYLIYKKYNFNKYNKSLLVSNNYAIVEIFIHYNNVNFEHIFFPRIYDVFNNIRTKIKLTYKFNDISKPIEMYNFIFFDVINYTYLNAENTEQINVNDKNCRDSLNYVYKLLDNLNINGDIIILINRYNSNDTLALFESVINCFTKTYIIFTHDITFPLLYLCGYKGKTEKSELSENFILEINKVNNMINKLNNDFYIKYKYYEDLVINNKNQHLLEQVEKKNLLLSIEIAHYIGFETYSFNINTDLSKCMQYMYGIDIPLYYIIKSRECGKLDLKINNNTNILCDIDEINKLLISTTNKIDYRPIHIYDYVKKYIRFYENSLNDVLFKKGIKSNGRKISRAWLKMYEILTFIDFKTMYKDRNEINIFHVCEAPGNFILSIDYYMKKYLPNTKYNWKATTLNENEKNAFGDDYNIIKNNKDKWTYGCDGIGDIKNKTNIEYYKNICKNMDWIIGDCGMGYESDNTECIKLYIAQIIFILHNLKLNGNCIFKCLIGINVKIIIDLFYILYNNFETIYLYKPIQNKFSPEYYVICLNYKKLDMNLDILFSCLDSTKSIIETYNNDFIYQFIKSINIITSIHIETIELQLFFCDFWYKISDEVKNEIKKIIKIKNDDFIKFYNL